jgi:putative drug exporter of the RND superfamily
VRHPAALRLVRARVGRAPRAYAWLVVWLRLPVLALWIAAATLAFVNLPSFGSSEGPVVQLIPPHAPALRTSAKLLRIFKVPAGSEFAVVVRDPNGLSAQAHAAVAQQALDVDRGGGGASGPSFAVPIANALRLLPGSRESGTTAITFLYYPPTMPVGAQMASAHHYVARLAHATGRPAALTGAIPGQFGQGVLIDHNMNLIELITLALIVLVIAVSYRSAAAPLVPLAAIGVAFPIALVGLHQLSTRFGIYVPQELDPIVIALMLGIITDYSIFFLSGVRQRRIGGEDRRTSVRATTAEITPIVLTSGVILSCGLLGLLVSGLPFFQHLGPALALTVAVALAVSLTLLPALLAVVGRYAYWPRALTDAPGRAVAPSGDARPYRFAYLMASRPAAALTAVVCIAALAVGAAQLRHLKLGFGQISDLPQSSAPKRAAHSAAEGFAPGILAPATILVQAPGVSAGLLHSRLAELESEVGRQPGVAGVLGPREQPTPPRFGVFLAPGGNAARIVVVFRDDPLGAAGIHDLQRLERAMPKLAGTAGVASAHISFAGDTALADDTVTAIHRDIVRVSAVVLAVNLLLLILFLRGIVAPIFLLLSSAAGVAAALGITTWVFQTYLGYNDLAYYVPFAVSVLLVSLGSDYNVFVVGRIWQEARVRPLRDAVAVAAPSAARTIRAAGITLAASFAVIAVIPVRSFREVAFAMVVGLLLETFVVRSLLVPALIALFGHTSGWPGRRLAAGAAEPAEDEPFAQGLEGAL